MSKSCVPSFNFHSTFPSKSSQVINFELIRSSIIHIIHLISLSHHIIPSGICLLIIIIIVESPHIRFRALGNPGNQDPHQHNIISIKRNLRSGIILGDEIGIPFLKSNFLLPIHSHYYYITPNFNLSKRKIRKTFSGSIVYCIVFLSKEKVKLEKCDSSNSSDSFFSFTQMHNTT